MENIRVLLGWVPVLLAPTQAREALEETLRLLDVRYWFNEAEHSLYIEPPLLSRRIRLVQGFPGAGPVVEALAERLRSAGGEVWVGQAGMESPPGPWHVTMVFASAGQGPTQVRANYAARRSGLWHGVNQALARVGIPTQARWMFGYFPPPVLRPVLKDRAPTLLIEATPPTWKELDPKAVARKLLRCVARTYAQPELLRLVDGWAFGQSPAPPLVAVSLGRSVRNTPAAASTSGGAGIASIMAAAMAPTRPTPPGLPPIGGGAPDASLVEPAALLEEVLEEPRPIQIMLPAVDIPRPSSLLAPIPEPLPQAPSPAPSPRLRHEPPPAAVPLFLDPDPEDALELAPDPIPVIAAHAERLPFPAPIAMETEISPQIPPEIPPEPPPQAMVVPPSPQPRRTSRPPGIQVQSAPISPPWWIVGWAEGRPFVPEQGVSEPLSAHLAIMPVVAPRRSGVQASDAHISAQPLQPPGTATPPGSPLSALQEARRWESTVIPVRSVCVTRHVRVQARKTSGA